MFGVVCVHFIYEQNAKHKKENNNIKSIIVSIGRICWDVFITLYPFKFPHIVVLYTCVSLGQPKKNGRQLYYVLLCWFGEVTWKELRSSTNWHVFCLMANKKNKQLRNIFLKKKKGSNKKLLIYYLVKELSQAKHKRMIWTINIFTLIGNFHLDRVNK